MIRCHLLNGEFVDTTMDGFEKVADSISENRGALTDMPLEAIISLLDKLGRSIIRDKNLSALEGASFISLWLRRENIERICRLNFGDNSYLDGYNDSGMGFSMLARPRGIVCHWVASNVPTLSFFSLVMGILTKNGNILKVSEENRGTLTALLHCLSKEVTEVNGRRYSGKDIINAISTVSFDSSEAVHGVAFSMIADCKIIWGGADSVKAITALPQKESCEIISFGPKYSFGVFDRQSIEDTEFRSNLRKTLRDVLLFNQMACSSPQVLFFEKSDKSLHEIAQVMKEELTALPAKLLKRQIPQSTATRIINARWTYLLSDDKDLVESEGLDWTILINKEPGLEEPVNGGCIFIKNVADLAEIVPYITRKIQAVVLCAKDRRKKVEFAMAAVDNGADRIVLPGRAHDFTLPWDGIMVLNRLVRWTILYSEETEGADDVERQGNLGYRCK